MSVELLTKILDTVTAVDHSPLTARRVLRSISRGDYTPGDSIAMSHDLFDWWCEFSRSDLSPEDQETMSVDPDSVTDEGERKRLIRRQSKIAKRARAATRTKPTKVTPGLVKGFEKFLDSDSPDAVKADQAGFVASLVPVLKPQELCALFDMFSETRYVASFGIDSYDFKEASTGFSWFTETVLWESNVQAAYDYWQMSHNPETFNQALSAYQDECLHLFETFKSELETGVEDEQVTIFNKAQLPRRSVVLVDCASGLKPKAVYGQNPSSLQVISERLKVAFPERVWLSLEEFTDCYSKTKIVDFKTPARMIFTIRDNEVEASPILATEELQANGNFMGNCTYSNYHKVYKEGRRVLFRIVYDGEVYNSDFHCDTGNLKECKGRRNSGNIPESVRDVNRLISERIKAAKNV